MTGTGDSIRASRRATRSFLVYRTAGGPAPPRSPGPPVGVRRLAERYRDFRTGRALMETARGRLQTESRFAVALIRVAGFPRVRRQGREPAVELLLDAARAIEDSDPGPDALWGLIEQDMFGLFLPDGDEKSARASVLRVRSSLGGRRTHPLAVGIAIHPFAEFRRPQVFGNARKALHHAERIGPGGTAVFDAVSLNISGDRRYQKGDIRGAIAEFSQALTLAPDDPNLLNSLAVCYGVRGALDAALENFHRAARLAPEEMMPVYNAGVVHRLRGEPDRALDRFEAAIRVGGIVFEAVFQAGRIYLETGDAETARERFRTAVRLRPRSGTAHRFLAESLLALDRPEEALAALRRAVTLNPRDAAGLSMLGERMDILGEDPEIALLYCRHSVEIAPKNALCHRRYGDACLRRGLLEEALAAYESASRRGADCQDRIRRLRTRRASNVS